MKLRFLRPGISVSVAIVPVLRVIATLIVTNAPAYAATPAVVHMNNVGVDELARKKYEFAIECFENALITDPSYSLARRNLAIAENNFGLSLRRKPMKAIKHLHRALLLDGANETTRQNLAGLLRMINKNPKSYEDRIALAESAEKIGEPLDARTDLPAPLKELKLNHVG
jgi:tetratricopeptide (TPR) repeat protein